MLEKFSNWKKRADKADSVIRAYRRLFSTEDGQIVMQDLMSSCFFGQTSVGKDQFETYFNEGARSVILRIMSTANMSEGQIKALRDNMLRQERDLFEEGQ